MLCDHPSLQHFYSYHGMSDFMIALKSNLNYQTRRHRMRSTLYEKMKASALSGLGLISGRAGYRRAKTRRQKEKSKNGRNADGSLEEGRWRAECKIKEWKRYETCARDVMQKIEVEHIGNNVISIFRALFFAVYGVDVEGRR